MSQEFKIKLPSKCKPYNDIDNEKITMRALKGKDEKIIAEMSYDNVEQKFSQLLSNVISGIDVNNLTLGDRMLCMIKLAIESYGSKHLIDCTCSHCFNTFVNSVDLCSLDVKELPDDFVSPMEVTLSDDTTIKLRLLTVADELKIVEYEKKNDNSWLYRYALSIVNNKSEKENVEFLEELGTRDVAKIRAFQEKYSHGPIMEVDYECSVCGGAGRMPLPFRIEMVFPIGSELERYFGDGV